MVDFAKQTTANYVRFYPVSATAKKYVDNGNGVYNEFYKPVENCTTFELPHEEGTSEYYARRLVEAGFHVQDVEAY